MTGKLVDHLVARTVFLLFRRQSFSGFITQFNLWDFDLEEYQIKNMATCRSDNYGNILQSKPDNFESSHEQTHVSIGEVSSFQSLPTFLA